MSDSNYDFGNQTVYDEVWVTSSGAAGNQPITRPFLGQSNNSNDLQLDPKSWLAGLKITTIGGREFLGDPKSSVPLIPANAANGKSPYWSDATYFDGRQRDNTILGMQPVTRSAKKNKPSFIKRLLK